MIHILVVEDAAPDMEFYQRTLQPLAQARFFYAKTGEEALSLAQREQIDMFLLDIDLPGMNGLELARQIRSLPRYGLTLILFITGYAENQLEAFKQLHCYDYIIKPFDAVELRAKIAELIRQLSAIRPESQKERKEGNGRKEGKGQEEGKRQEEKKGRMYLFPGKENDYLIPILTVRYAEILRGNCTLYTDLQAEPYKSDTITLTELVESMNDPYFVRCQKSFAVNVRKIRQLKEINYRLWRVELDHGEEVDVTKKYFEQVKNQWEQWMQGQGA